MGEQNPPYFPLPRKEVDDSKDFERVYGFPSALAQLLSQPDRYPSKRNLQMIDRGLTREERAAELSDQASLHAMKAELYRDRNNPMARYHTEAARRLRRQAETLVS
jgi:hypothetical protein